MTNSDHNVNDYATAETRAKGGLERARRIRERKEEAKRLLVERLSGELEADLAKLNALSRSDDEKVALAAIREKWDRLLGKPAQGVELTGEDGGPVEVDVGYDAKELARQLAALVPPPAE